MAQAQQAGLDAGALLETIDPDKIAAADVPSPAGITAAALTRAVAGMSTQRTGESAELPTRRPTVPRLSSTCSRAAESSWPRSSVAPRSTGPWSGCPCSTTSRLTLPPARGRSVSQGAATLPVGARRLPRQRSSRRHLGRPGSPRRPLRAAQCGPGRVSSPGRAPRRAHRLCRWPGPRGRATTLRAR